VYDLSVFVDSVVTNAPIQESSINVICKVIWKA